MISEVWEMLSHRLDNLYSQRNFQFYIRKCILNTNTIHSRGKQPLVEEYQVHPFGGTVMGWLQLIR